MRQEITRYVHGSFEKLVTDYGFVKVSEVDEGGDYMIDYRSSVFGIRLEKYHREFYATVYKSGESTKEINLFNLLSYLNQSSSIAPEANYFRNETNEEICFKKQVMYIATTIYENLLDITKFFNYTDYEARAAEVEAFMVKRYPELFKKHNRISEEEDCIAERQDEKGAR